MFDMRLGMLLWAAVVVALVVLAIVVVARAVRRSTELPIDAGHRRDDWLAEDEVRIRYARGELDSEEFRRRMQDLRDS